MPEVQPIAIKAQVCFVSHDLALIGQSQCLFLRSIKRNRWANATTWCALFQVEDSSGKHEMKEEQNTSQHQLWLSVGCCTCLLLKGQLRSTRCMSAFHF